MHEGTKTESLSTLQITDSSSRVIWPYPRGDGCSATAPKSDKSMVEWGKAVSIASAKRCALLARVRPINLSCKCAANSSLCSVAAQIVCISRRYNLNTRRLRVFAVTDSVTPRLALFCAMCRCRRTRVPANFARATHLQRNVANWLHATLQRSHDVAARQRETTIFMLKSISFSRRVLGPFFNRFGLDCSSIV